MFLISFLRFQTLVVCINDLKPLLHHFNTFGKAQSETFAFWLEYCDMVFLLLEFIAAERDSDWTKHLELFQEMIVYDRAFDRYRYSVGGLFIYVICWNYQVTLISTNAL